MLKMVSHHEKTKESHNCHCIWTKYPILIKDWQHQMLVRMRSNWNSHTWLVGAWNSFLSVWPFREPRFSLWWLCTPGCLPHSAHGEGRGEENMGDSEGGHYGPGLEYVCAQSICLQCSQPDLNHVFTPHRVEGSEFLCSLGARIEAKGKRVGECPGFFVLLFHWGQRWVTIYIMRTWVWKFNC